MRYRVRRLALLPTATSILLLAAHAEGKAPGPTLGLLPTQSPAAWQDTLSSALPRELERTLDAPVLRQNQLVERLANASGTRAIDDAARLAIAQAEGHELKMERDLSLALATRAIAQLRRTGARFYAPRLWADAHIALARAQLLRPPDPTAAREALREALRVNPRIVANAHPPRLARLVEQVRQHDVAARVPQADELASLSRRAGVARLLWLDVRPRGGRVALRLATHDLAHQSYAATEQLVESAQVPKRTAALASWSFGTVALTGRLPAAPVTTHPWYRRWWVWTTAGVVIAAVATAAVVATAPHNGFTFHLGTSGAQ